MKLGKQLRPGPRNKAEGKPSAVAWLGLAIGVFSLFISAVGQYYSVLLQQDDLRAIVQLKWEDAEEGTPLAERTAINSITLINSGNRSALVTQIEYWLVKVPTAVGGRENCGETAQFRRTYALTPTILRPGDFAVPPLKDVATIESNTPIQGGDNFWYAY